MPGVASDEQSYGTNQRGVFVLGFAPRGVKKNEWTRRVLKARRGCPLVFVASACYCFVSIS